MVGNWRDKRDVTYLSTELKNEIVLVQRQEKYMSGVECSEKMISYYRCSWKVLRCYKKMRIHTFQMLLHNVWILYKKNSENRLRFYDFRLRVLEKLLPQDDATKIKALSWQAAPHLPTKITATADHGKTRRKKE